MHSLFFSNVPVSEPLRFPQQGPYEESCPFTSPFLRVSQIPYKISRNKEIYPFSQRPYERRDLHVPQKRVPYGNRRLFPEPYSACLLESPVKEPSLQVPLISSLRERCPTPGALLHLSFKVPRIRAPIQVPQWGPYGERCPSPEPSFTHPPGSPRKPPPLRFPSQSSHREICSTSKAPFIHLSKSLVNEHLSRFPTNCVLLCKS